MKQERKPDGVVAVIKKPWFKNWAPVAVIVLALTASFLYGWYGDSSKPQSGEGWADQQLYAKTAQRLASGRLPSEGQLHFPVGYPMIGAVGSFITDADPFVLISYILLIASALFVFTATTHLYSRRWGMLVVLLLFLWDGNARTLHTASEIFSIPWNNQVLFFAFAFFFWLLVTQTDKQGMRLLAITGAIAGFTVATREEAIIFMIPLCAGWLILGKAQFRKWILLGSFALLFMLPQLVIKQHVLGSITESGHDVSYEETKGRYLQPKQLYRNTIEILINSKQFQGQKLHPVIQSECDKTPGSPICQPDPKRVALLQAQPWLLLSPFGLAIILYSKRYTRGLKLFVLVSGLLTMFYLSGTNMAAQKLRFNCLRYISPAFIAMNLGSVAALYETSRYYNERKKKPSKT